MDNCIFCKIVRGEIPSAQVLDADKVLALLDISPVNKGHVLVVPKEHFETMLDVPDNLLKDMILAAKKVGKGMRKGLKADGFNLSMNNFAAAGQVVFHAHLHVIPRFENDGLKHWPQKHYDEGEMDSYREKIATFL